MTFCRRLSAILLSIILFSACKTRINKESVSFKFCIPDSLMQMIQIDTVKLAMVENEIKLVGKVSVNEEKEVKIYPLVSGLVTEVKVELGDNVLKGQTLAIIKSSEMANIENDLTTAESNLAVAKRNLTVTEEMYKSGLSSETEYLASQKEKLKAESEYKKVSSILEIYGTTGNSEYIVKSPITGCIVEKFITPNMQIRPDNSVNLFSISDLKNVWVLANVYESDIASIKKGETVTITTIPYPDRKLTGKIDKVYNVLDPDNKTMKVRIQLDNSENLLKPEMFANVIVHQTIDSSMLAVPSNSVVFDRNKYWVINYKSRCDLQVIQVDIAASTSSFSYVRSGLQTGEKVITKNQLLIYNALNQ